MRKFLLTIGILGIIAGVGIWVAGMTKLDWNFMELDMTKYEAQVFVSEEVTELDAIKIDSVNWNYSFVESNDSKIYVDYFTSDRSNMKVSVNDGELLVTEKFDKNFGLGMFQYLKSLDKVVVIKIPKGMIPNLEVNSVNSDINVQIDLGAIVFNNTNGDFVAESQSFGDITANLFNGDIKLTDVKAGKLTSETTSGDVKLTRTIITGMQVELVNGDIILDKVICPVLDMETVSGSVIGSIVGNALDYQVAYSSINGKSNLGSNSDSTRTKSIKLETINGDLSITFVTA